jgi:hypothetical protein
MKRTHFILIGLLPIQGLILMLIKNNPSWVESYYSQLVYPFIFDTHRLFFEKFSFSVGDLLYAFLVLFIAKNVVSIFKKKKPSWRAIVRQGLSFVSLILLFFNLNWGLNYYRTPLYQDLGYQMKYNETELEATFSKLVTISNQLHSQLSENDTTAVTLHYSKTKIGNLIEKEFDFDLKKMESKPYLKQSLWSTLLSYMGYAGYLNPFTLESQANSKIPKLDFIITAAHEMAHQLGIASEGEANFIAFYTSIKHSDPFLQYAGYTFALRYCYAELYKANPENAKEKLKTLHPGILKNYKELSEFWKQYQNPFEPLLKKGYDSYLKANGQAKGIQSYSTIVGYVVAYAQKASFNLN